MKYTLTFSVSRVNSDVEEVTEEAELDFAEVMVSGYSDDGYVGQYEITYALDGSKDDASAISFAKEIIEASAFDIDIFSVQRDGETIFTEEDEEQ